MTSILSTLYVSDFDTREAWVRLRLRFVVFLVRMWLLKAFFLLIFPVPVNLNLFFAPECVFVFGIVCFLNSLFFLSWNRSHVYEHPVSF